MFQIYNSTGSLEFFWKDCLGMAVVYIILSISISTIIYFSLNIFRTVYRHTKHRKSKKNWEIHRQLFQTLIIQTLIPMCILFIPTGFLLTLPFFDVKYVGRVTNAPGVGASLYPALDALTAILMIREFRTAFKC